YHALLDLRQPRLERPSLAPRRPLADPDWPGLQAVFADAFADQVPFAALDLAGLREAAEVNLTRTRTGGDGPLIAPASFVALDGDGTIIGGTLITLVPLNDPTHWDSCIWDQAPPEGAIEKRLGRPHLTWVFVRP